MENESRKYDVIITDTAWAQMIEHARFLANVSVEAASRLVDDFVEGSGTLAQMPQRCPWLVHDTIPFQKYRKILFGKHHMALFQIRDNTVYIAAVVDCRQDYGWML
jgi:plasmid stabilization system protein ParE